MNRTSFAFVHSSLGSSWWAREHWFCQPSIFSSLKTPFVGGIPGMLSSCGRHGRRLLSARGA